MKNFLQVNRALAAEKNFNFNFKHLLVLSAVLLLGSVQVWGTGTYKMIVNGALNSNHFWTTASLTKSSETIQDESCTHYLSMGGSPTSISSCNRNDRMVKYDQKTNSTMFEVYYKHTNGSTHYIYATQIIEGEEPITKTCTLSVQKSDTFHVTFTSPNNKKASIYFFTNNNSRALISQIKANENGTEIPNRVAGRVGYSFDCTKVRALLYNGTEHRVDSMSICGYTTCYPSQYDYITINAKGTNYIRMYVPTACKMIIKTVEADKKFDVIGSAPSSSGTYNRFTSKANDTIQVDVSAGDCYITPNGNTVKISKISFEADEDDCTPITPTWLTDYSSTVLTAGGSKSSTPTVEKDGSSGAVSFAVTSASPSGSVTVNSSTGVVTPVKVGTATITATVAANGDYCSGTVTKNFTIKGTITYNANGDGAGNATGTTGSVPTDANLYASGASITVAGKSTLAKTNCAFAGWNTAANGSGTWYDPGASISMGESNITLYAQWAPCISTTDFTARAFYYQDLNSGDPTLAQTQTDLTSYNFKHSLGGNTRYDTSDDYQGLKLRNSGDWIGFGVPAGNAVTITTQTVNTSPAVTIDFSSATTLSEKVDNEYEEANTIRYFRIKAANGNAVVIDQISITPSCTAPSSVSVAKTTEDGNYGWRYTTGQTLKLTATATGGSGGSYTYQWKKKTGESTWKNLTDGVDATDGGTFSGTTSANLVISGLTAGNAGTYKCVVSTGLGCDTESNEFWVRVFTLDGNYSGEDWIKNPIVWTDEYNGTATVTLDANSVYQFKVTDNDSHWYGLTSPDIYKDEDNFVIYRNDANNVALHTGKVAGKYTFTVNVYHANDNENPKITLTAVRYPKMTIYMSGGSTTWCSANPVFFAHTYGQADNDVKMTEHTCESGLFYADVPSYNTKVTFTRQKPGSESIAWSGDNFWNKSKDEIVIGSNNKFTCTGWENNEGVFSGSSYSPSTYTITFASNGSDGGSAMSNVTAIPCDENRTLVANTWTKTGHTFGGWVANVDVKVGGETKTAGTVIDDEETIQNIRSNITLTAQWSVKSYDLTWNLAGGTTTSTGTGIGSGVSSNTTTSQAFGTALTAPTVTKTGYKFSAWSPSVASTMPAAATTYTATWTAKTYTISYYDSGAEDEIAFSGNHMPSYPTSHTYGTATTLKKASKAGYVFGGWYGNYSCSGDPITSYGATDITSDQKLYAKWTAMNLTPLANGTLYTASDMVPDGVEIGDRQYYPGVSGNNIFNILGTGNEHGATGPLGSATCSDPKIPGSTFDKSLYFRNSLSISGTTLPTSNAIQFKVSQVGLLDIYCANPVELYLIKDGESAVQLDASETDKVKITKAVSYGTYYIYAVNTNSKEDDLRLYGLKFTPNYTITYNTDGADESQQTNGSKTHGVNFTLSSTRYTKDGYWQTGWATERGGSQVYAFGATYTDNADLTLYPAWAVKAEYEPDLSTSAKLTAAVISDGRWMLTTGANVVSDPSTVGGDAAMNLTGDKYGLAFAPGGDSKATFDLGAITTIYKLTVQMVSGCKEAWPTIQFENEDYDDNLDEDPEWDEESAWTLKTFTYTYDEGVSGWRYLNFYGYDGCYLGLHSIKIEYAPTKTYIQLDNQSATSAGTTGVTATYGASTNLTSSIIAPSKTGYIFGGYYTEEDGEGTQLIDENGAWLASKSGYTDGSKNWQYPDADLTLYAKWTEDECGITLTQFGTQYKTSSPRRLYAYTSNSFSERFIIETDGSNEHGVSYSKTDSLYLYLNNGKKVSVNASDVVKENDSIFTDVTKIKFKYQRAKSKSLTLTFDVYVGATKVGSVSQAVTDDKWYTETINVSPAKDGRVTFKNTGSSSDYALHFDAINICGTLPDPCTEITPTWSTDYTSTTLNVGATSSTPVVGKDGSSGSLSFSSSDDAIATVNSSGVVTAVKSGSVTITATVAEDEENNKCEGTVTKTFTIKAGITYNTNGADSGDAPTDATYYAANADITILGNTGSMIKDGKVFNGWNTKANGSGTHYEVGATMKMPNKSAGVTLFAEWVGYATSWEWWNSGEGNGSTTFTYLTNKNYVLSFTTNGDNKATWDISGGQYYRGVKLKTKDDNMSFWVQTGKRVSITFGTRPTKPTFTVGGVDKSSDVGASTNSDSVTVTYTTSADTKFYIENETSTGTAFTIKRVKIEDACTSITPSLNHSSKTLYAFGGTPRQVALVVSGNTGSGDVTWTSSDDGVATVTSDGLVTAVAPGTATITATIEATGDYCAGEAECTITVPALVTQTINVGNSDAAASWGTPPNMSFNDPTSTLTQNAVIDVSAGYTFNKEETYKGNRGGRYMTAQIKAANGVMSDSKYLSLSFNSPSHDVRVGEVIVPIQPVTDKLVAKASISDGTTTVWSAQSDSLAAGSITDAKFTFSPTVLKAGTITVKVYVYGQPTDKGFRLANTIYVNGAMLVDQRFTDANSTGIWSDPANWDGGSLPEIYHDVVIEKPVKVDIAHATAKSIVIYNNGSDKTGKLTIQPNKGLEVDGTIQKTTDGSTKTATGEADLVLESSSAGNASLIFNNSNSCAATVQMYSKGSIDGATWKWQYVGTPFTGSIPQYNYYGSWMYKWDNGGWAVVKGGDELDPFAGYCLTQESATTHVMGGTLVPTTSKSVTMAASTDMVLANSWTAPISIASFDIEGGDATFTSTPATIYLFNTGMAENGSEEYVSGDEAGTYVTVPINSAPYTGNGLIAPMQGFFVTTNGGAAGTITMNYNDLVRPSGEHTDIVAGPMKAPKRIEERPEVMKIRAEGSVYNDRVVILSREDFSQGFDNGWDGKKMSFGNASPSVYVINEEGGYDAVSAIPEYEGTVVGFRAGTDSEYTIRFEYDGEEMLYLNDLQEQEATPIDSMRTYTFTAEAGDNEARFIISATPVQKVTTGVDPASGGQDAKVRKVIINDHIYIIRGGRMYSVDGALVK